MKNSKKRIMFSAGIANTFEWYDYTLFGHFAYIIGSKFLPDADPKAVTLKAFLVFAVGYMMRPLGGIVFGIIGDKFGRKKALSIALICMALPTAMVGLLPTYDQIGISASVLIIVVRMLQGLSMGGALTGSISFLIEHSKPKERGFIGSIPMMSICIGVLSGSLVAYLARSSMTAAAFDSFGWRLPFLIGIVVMAAGFYIQKHTAETPMFEKTRKNGDIIQNPLSHAIKYHWKDILVSIAINATGSVLFYLQAIYLVNFLKENRGFSADEVDNLSIVSYVAMIFLCMIAGKLSDIIGRTRLYILLLTFVIVSYFQVIYFIEYGAWSEVYLGQMLLCLLAAFYIGPEPALQAELYPTAIRATALSISYNTATSIFGGTTPYVIEYLHQNTGSLYASGYYVVTVSIIGLVGIYFYKNRSVQEEVVKVAHQM